MMLALRFHFVHIPGKFQRGGVVGNCPIRQILFTCLFVDGQDFVTSCHVVYQSARPPLFCHSTDTDRTFSFRLQRTGLECATDTYRWLPVQKQSRWRLESHQLSDGFTLGFVVSTCAICSVVEFVRCFLLRPAAYAVAFICSGQLSHSLRYGGLDSGGDRSYALILQRQRADVNGIMRKIRKMRVF